MAGKNSSKYGPEFIDKIIGLYESGGVPEKLAREYDIPSNTIRYWIKHFSDADTAAENIGLRKKNQKLTDQKRIQTKAYRETDRWENAVGEWLRELKEEIGNLGAGRKLSPHKKTKGTYTGIIQLSDVHFNECVHDVGGNSYDFTIAGKRLRKHVHHAMKWFDAYGVKSVALCCTADMFNSDRRLDELLSNANNRAKGFLLGFDIMRQLVCELADKYHVTVASVCGNEGRIDQIREYGEELASNNFDFMLHECLDRAFEKVKHVQFVYQQANYCILDVNGMNIMLLHGDNAHAKQTRKMATENMAKFIHGLGVRIDYVLSGHIHEAYISDLFARSGSTVGNNAYSWDALNLGGKASQNCYIVAPEGRAIHGMKVDLQDSEHFEGYDVTPQLEAYNSKSAIKNSKPTVIHQVVI